jgi:RHS repeat-associated protein
LTFDPESRMTAYGGVLTAGYNADGLRAWKQNSNTRTYFLYDGILPVVEMDSTGAVTATNTVGAGGLVSRREGNTTVFYSFDSEGNVAEQSDSSGAVLSEHLFSAHGNVLSGNLVDPFGYKAEFGYYTDNETGHQLLTHRYYDPSTGRFLTRDPIDYAGGINLYGYVENNPVNFTDTNGPSKGDRWYGYNDRDFHKWFHRCWKQRGDPDANKNDIEAAHAEWLRRGSPKGGNCWGGGTPDPYPCREPVPARKRIPGPSLEEFRMQEEAARQMEQFWTKILLGDAAAGAVLLAPEGAGAVVLRWIGVGGRLVPVP